MKDITEAKRRLEHINKNLEFIDKNLEKLHDCDKCHGKMVGISVDVCGNTYCGYCGKRIDYFKDIKEE